MKRQSLLAGVLSIGFLLVLIGAWHLSTLPKAKEAGGGDAEYAKLMGKSANKTEGMPTPAQMGDTVVRQLSDPFYDRGPNDKGIAEQVFLATEAKQRMAGLDMKAPASSYAKFKVMGKEFDPMQPDKYLASFPIKKLS